MEYSIPFVDKVVLGNGRVCPVLQAQINATADGDNTVIAAPGVGFEIVPLAVFVTSTASAVVTYKSGANTLWTCHQFTNLHIPHCLAPYPLPACNPNEAFIVSNSVGQDTLGVVIYAIMPV